jgi:two-component system heavy metal sensor histidine kinase CusS
MKLRLHFTTKVAWWSGWLAAAVLVVFVVVLKAAHRQLGVGLVDNQLREECGRFFAAYRAGGARAEWITLEAIERAVTVARDPHIRLEVTTGDGRVVATGEHPDRVLEAVADGPGWVEIDDQEWRAFGRTESGVRIRIASDLAHEREEEAVLDTVLVFSLPLALLGVGLGARFVARQALRPVREMAAAAGQISAQRLAERLPETEVNDEIGQLARAFNATLNRLETSFAQAVRFSADASHELRTPLAVARAGLGELMREPTLANQHRQQVGEMLEQIGRLTDITESLLLLSRADAGRLELSGGGVEAAAVVRQLAADFSPVAEERGLTLVAKTAEAAPVKGEAWALRMVVVNLLDNAIKYNGEGGRIQVTLTAEADRVTLRVGNTGKGVGPDEAGRLFDRFYRAAHTTEVRGSGLGLSLARELARAMGGDLVLAVATREWTEFELTLRAAR